MLFVVKLPSAASASRSASTVRVQIEISRERRRPVLGDCSRNASRMLMRRRGLWLGSAHHLVSSNHVMLPPGPVARLMKISEIHYRLRRPPSVLSACLEVDDYFRGRH